MARKDKLSKLIRDEWPTKLDAELKSRFGVDFTTHWNVVGGPPSYVTARNDGGPMTDEMINFIHGYMVALNHVFTWNGRV